MKYIFDSGRHPFAFFTRYNMFLDKNLFNDDAIQKYLA